MTTNIGSFDRIARIAVGLALLAYAILGTGAYAWLGYIGIVPLATALLGSCPAYSLLGISTCPTKRA